MHYESGFPQVDTYDEAYSVLASMNREKESRFDFLEGEKDLVEHVNRILAMEAISTYYAPTIVEYLTYAREKVYSYSTDKSLFSLGLRYIRDRMNVSIIEYNEEDEDDDEEEDENGNLVYDDNGNPFMRIIREPDDSLNINAIVRATLPRIMICFPEGIKNENLYKNLCKYLMANNYFKTERVHPIKFKDRTAHINIILAGARIYLPFANGVMTTIFSSI